MAYKNLEDKRKYNREYMRKRREDSPKFKEYHRSVNREYVLRITPEALERRRKYNREYNRIRRQDPSKRKADLEGMEKWAYKYPTKELEEVGVTNRKWTQIKIKYKLSPHEYLLLLYYQDGACAICKTKPSKGKILNVDHDHTTGKVRGLLCPKCNLVMGQIESLQSIDLVHAMLDYISDAKN
jgi:hypothetical protein